jgi:hypothetical protein
MAVIVSEIVDNAKLILQEVTADGTRWKNAEIMGWLNEFYRATVQLRPDAFSVNESMALITGTKQTIPVSGLRLLDVIRNGTGMAVMVTTRRALDSARRGWHSDTPSVEVEQFTFDELDPTHFYVYPPALSGAEIDILYSATPDSHDTNTGLTDNFRLSDAYAPVAADYLLYRAFSKDAETPANLQRAQMHYQNYMQQMGNKAQADSRASPNAVDASANPQRARA